MIYDRHLIGELKINPSYLDVLKDFHRPWLRWTVVHILVVVDEQIATAPGAGFGVGSVIELIRNSSVGCMHFAIDIAQRSAQPPSVVANHGPYAPKYNGFRFDMMDGGSRVIDHYQQIWIFGFMPGNDAGPDSHIDQPNALPATNSELDSLSTWMNDRHGGLFATGDHDYLGASICHRIPRIGTMRRWTNADGVPPIGGHFDPDTAQRIDTLRPPSPAYEPGWPGGPLPLTLDPQQGDLTPQPIQWVAWQRARTGLFTYTSRPHPVLCHPSLGPIDVMPDHAHEGLCRDTGTIALGNTYNFGSGDKPEYPPAAGGGTAPEPTVIAYGSTLGDPPYNFYKGAQPARAHFPMISVYDGHLANVGRVATDSTWHHWFDVNITNMKVENGSNWAKISRYYINLAVWLAPPGYSTHCLWWCILVSHFTDIGFQEYSAKLDNVTLGQAAYLQLRRIYGPCWVSHVLFDILRLKDFQVVEIPHKPFPPQCLTCPPFELFELAALGGLVRAQLPLAAKIAGAISAGEKRVDVSERVFEETLHEGTLAGVHAAVELWSKELDASRRRLDILGRRPAAD